MTEQIDYKLGFKRGFYHGFDDGYYYGVDSINESQSLTQEDIENMQDFKMTERSDSDRFYIMRGTPAVLAYRKGFENGYNKGFHKGVQQIYSQNNRSLFNNKTNKNKNYHQNEESTDEETPPINDTYLYYLRCTTNL